MTLSQAQEIADEQGLDLVQLSTDGDVAVCKLMNYDKFLYEQKKKDKLNKKCRQELKEVRFSDVIAENDARVKAKTVERLLNEGDKVKLTIIYKGRLMKFISRGLDKVAEFEKMVNVEHTVDKQPAIEGNRVYMIISPKK